MKTGLVCFILASLITSNTFAASDSAKEFAEQKKPVTPQNAVPFSNKDLMATAPMNFEELKNFLRDWRKYNHWLAEGNNQYEAVAYMGVSASADYPSPVVRWVEEHGWTCDRFFLLELKVRRTLAVIRMEERRNTLIASYRSQLESAQKNTSISQSEKNALIKRLQADIRDTQRKAIQKAPVTPAEYDLIKLNKDPIAVVLKDIEQAAQ